MSDTGDLMEDLDGRLDYQNDVEQSLVSHNDLDD